jgi:hypothetical protein
MCPLFRLPEDSQGRPNPMTPNQIAQIESALCWVAFVAFLVFTVVLGDRKGWWDE